MRHFQQQILLLAAVTIAFSATAFAQQVQRAPFDVTNYLIDAQLSPDENKLSATADVTFVPKEDTRTVSFELNGSLKLESITRVDKLPVVVPTVPPTTKAKPAVKPVVPAGEVTFVQDQVGVSDLGPSVRIDLGDTVTKGTTVTLRFKYSGVLNTPSGGPLLTKRLAYVGDDEGYLMYAARWFPFHDYAADPATSDISITAPAGLQVVGYSDAPVTTAGGKYRFVQSKPGLVGNFSYAKFVNKTLRFGDYELQFYTRPGNENLIADYGETLGKALQYYTSKFGAPEMGKRLIVTQIDDESVDFYSSLGMLFIANRRFEEGRRDH